MLYKLNFTSKTQLLNNLMKLKVIVPKKDYICNRIDVNVTPEGIYLLATDGFRICNINFGDIDEKLKKELDLYSEQELYFTISYSLLTDTIDYIKTLSKVETVKLKGGNVAGVKITGIINNEKVEKWFTEQASSRLPDSIYEYVAYPKLIKRRFSFKETDVKVSLPDELLKTLREIKKEFKDKEIVTLKLENNYINIGINKDGFIKKVKADKGTSLLAGYNLKFLMAMLRRIKKANIEFYNNGEYKPVRVVSNNNTIEQILLPVRLK